MIRTSHRCFAALSVAAALTSAVSAQAFPGFFAGKDEKKRLNHATHVVVMMQGDKSAVTILPDYDGPVNDTFAMVIPVPPDVSLDFVKSMKRDPVDRVDQLSAPRFHEFWEKEPCDLEPQIQEWERDLSVKGAGFLGPAMPIGEANRTVPKELRLAGEPVFKDQEYKFHLIAPDTSPLTWLKSNGYKAPEGAEAALKKYAGMQTLVVEVDPKRIELTAAGAVLSPFRFTTQQPVKINSTLGLLNSDGAQEIFIYAIHPTNRFEAKNYKNVFAPTNLQVDFKVKERMGEFYAGMHDLLLKKDAQAFVVEFAWNMTGCGEPCPNDPILLQDKLTLGADFFESFVPKEQREPEPPPLTPEEEEQIKNWKKAKTPEAKEELERFEKTRVDLAARKALLSRQEYVLTRLHHRYSKETLPNDVELAPAPHIEGGIEIPKGPAGTLPTEVRTGVSGSKFQTRYSHLHPNKVVINCDAPQKHRWGIPPKTYRGYRKVWTAQDIATKNRTSHQPAALVTTAYPALGLPGMASEAEKAAAPPVAPVAPPKVEESSCALALSTGSGSTGLRGALGLLGLLALGLVRRRRS